MTERKCLTCKYWEDEVCCCAVNGEVADFAEGDFACKWHEFKEDGPSEDK